MSRKCPIHGSWGLTCGTNSVDLQQKITAQSSQIRTLKKEHAKQIEANKQLDGLIQVAAASYKRERSENKGKTNSKPAYRSSSRDGTQCDPDVQMTDVSQMPKPAYPDKRNRADKSNQTARADNAKEKIQTHPKSQRRI